ncbi:sodium:calcium antiporter [Candidatus Woesearchaeota archaeon]|nr:sodium:calcium antiporter [Candidatus Woesearchaeota archaeon]
MVTISQSSFGNIILGIFAILSLIFFSNKVIEKSIKISKRLGISQMFIGLTIISIGTSLPEITTHIVASIGILKGNLDYFIASSTVIGINIGSDIVQQTFILGIIGLLAVMHSTPLKMKKSFLKKDFLIMIVASALLLLLAIDGKISRTEGALMFFGYMAYLWALWKKENKRKNNKAPINKKDKKGLFADFAYIILGIIIIFFSAEYILKIAEFFVANYNIGASLIGVVIIGVAAALPEFTTSVTAILKNSSSISIGTLIGSNITNPMFALGLGAMISSYHVPKPVIIYDVPVKIATAVLVMWMLWKNEELTKKNSAVMVGTYLIYAVIRLKYFSLD